MHIIGSIVLACQSQKQLMLWAFMPASRKPLALRPKSARSYFFFLASSLIMTEFSFMCYPNFLVSV